MTRKTPPRIAARRAHGPASRRLMRLVVFASFAVAAACGGGGGGGGGGPTPLTVTYASSNPSPVAGDVSLQAVSRTAATFTADVAFTDMDDVFAATLTLTYDPNVVRFDAFSFANTFMTAGPTGAPFLSVSDNGAGTVRIAASRLAPDPGVNVAGTRSLVRLTFTARRATSGSPMAFSGNLEVCDSQANPDAVCDANGAIAVNSYTGGTVRATN